MTPRLAFDDDPGGKYVHVVDLTDQTETDRIGFVRIGTPEADALCEWLRFHGLDPWNIPGGSVIWRNERDHTIRYVEIVRDADGRKVWQDGRLVLARRIEQNEAGPLPFPAVIALETTGEGAGEDRRR